MKKCFNCFIIIFSILLIFLYSGKNSFSYPKYAAYTGEKCVSCHINPSGGGLRNLYGVKYSKENLYFKFLEKANKSTEINTMISKGIQVGADMRMLFLDDQTGPGSPNLNSFFQMQGDLYVNGQLNKYLNLVVAPGLY